jgi:hypothetical protein
MSALAVIRPNDWELPLFVHVLAGFVLIGALFMAATYLFAARRDGSVELTRAGFRSLLIVALPAWRPGSPASGSRRRRTSRTPRSPGSRSATPRPTPACCS